MADRTIRIAVTVWDERISPVFDASRRLLVAEIQCKSVTERSYLVFDPGQPRLLAETLLALDVSVLICGAVTQVPAAIIAEGGITLIPFITGRVDQVIEAYAQGTSLAPTFLMPGCHGGSVTGTKTHQSSTRSMK